MSLRCTYAMIVMSVLAQAAPLSISLSLDKDTVVPYEPLLVRVRVANSGDAAVAIPDIGRLTGSVAFDFRFETQSGEELEQGMRFSITRSHGLGQPQLTLAPGETVTSRAAQIGEWTGMPDPENERLRCFRPGVYSVRAFWQVGMLPESFMREQISSTPSFFTVVEPTALQKPALALYRDLAASLMLPPRVDSRQRSTLRERVRAKWADVEGLAKRMISQCPAEPYVVLAEVDLAHDYWSRGHGFSQFLDDPKSAEQWSDSMVAAYRRVVEDHPDSPIAAEYLTSVYGMFASGVDGSKEYLSELQRRVPSTRVARVAASILESLTESRK